MILHVALILAVSARDWRLLNSCCLLRQTCFGNLTGVAAQVLHMGDFFPSDACNIQLLSFQPI
jgi:hypothetical protein